MSLWTADELQILVQAWDEIQSHELESERSHCERIYDRFTDLCGGYTERTEQAIYLQRSVLSYNYKLIVEYEKARKRNGVPGGWFELSPQGRAQAYRNNESRSYRFVDLNRDMFAAIDRIKKRAPLATAAKPEAPEPRPPPKQKAKTAFVKRIWEPNTADSRLLTYEWSHEELLNLVRAWRDEVRDCRSHLGSKSVAKVMNKRIYERFAVLCNGFTTRTESAVATKKRDLTHSYYFIARINAQQRKQHQRMWFAMTKIEKLALFHGADRSAHLGDMPEDVFLRIAKVLDDERALGLREKRSSAVVECNDGGLEEEDEEDEPYVKSSPSVRARAARQQSLSNKKKFKSSVEYHGASVNRDGLTKKSPDAKSLSAHLAELRQIAATQEGQARRVKEIVREIDDANRVGDGAGSTLLAQKDPSKVVTRARGMPCSRGPRNGLCETQTMDSKPQARVEKTRARSSTAAAQSDPRSTRSLAQNMILKLQNQGGTASPAWYE